ncbi:MAG: DUF4412 domain-containing protein [Verrucomicrobia bacterium]|nr:DUF4412 domain-containing protein [Verrucomicrobiota bacterium]
MKKIALFFALMLTILPSAQADWTLIQKTTTDGKADEMIIKVKGDKTRADIGKQMSMISDAASGEIVMFMHEQKMMMKMNGDSMKGIMALAGNLLGKGEPAAKPAATGKMEKVGEHEAEIYTWSGKIGSGKFWVAKNFEHFAELNAIQDKLMKAMGNPAAAMVPSNSDFPGMIVKSEMSVMGKTATSELVSAKQDPIDDAVFTAPEGYQEMKMPSLPGQ